MPKKTMPTPDIIIGVDVIKFKSFFASFRDRIPPTGTTVTMTPIYIDPKLADVYSGTRLSIKGKPVVIEFRFRGVYKPVGIDFTKQAGDDPNDPSGAKDFPKRQFDVQSCFITNKFKDAHAVYKFQFSISDGHGNIGVTDPIITHDTP